MIPSANERVNGGSRCLQHLHTSPLGIFCPHDRLKILREIRRSRQSKKALHQLMGPKRSRASAPSKGAAKKRQKAPTAKAAPKPAAPTGAYIITHKTPTGQVKHDVWWRATTKKPQYIQRSAKIVEGARYARRPSKRAWAAGLRYSSDCWAQCDLRARVCAVRSRVSSAVSYLSMSPERGP